MAHLRQDASSRTSIISSTSTTPSEAFVPGTLYARLDEELAALGLRKVTQAADGNCFFRAMADQLQGPRGDHRALRREIVDYIVANKADFAPFVEDDEPFERYCSRMRRDGTWAGNMELQAASMLRRVNLCIHQEGAPLWLIPNFPDQDAFVHLTFEHGSHYNSVRRAADKGDGPGGPFELDEVTTAIRQARAALAADAAAQAAPTQQQPSPAQQQSAPAAAAASRQPDDARSSAAATFAAMASLRLQALREGRDKRPPANAEPQPQPQPQQAAPAAAPGPGTSGAAAVAAASATAAAAAARPAASVALVSGVEIAYELLGPATGPTVVLTPGGRQGMEGARWLAVHLASRGYAALLWDRPNCGSSGVCFSAGTGGAGVDGEAGMQATFLAGLLLKLGRAPAVLVGVATGGRLALLFALHYAHLTAALVLVNLPAGNAAAARMLSNKYHQRYVDLADMYPRDCMERLLAHDPHYAALAAARPTTRAALLRLPVAEFRARHSAWASELQAGGGDGWLTAAQTPALGLDAARLRLIAAPALCLHTQREPDGVHTLEAMRAVAACLTGCVAPPAGTVPDRAAWLPTLDAFLDGLPRPLQAVPHHTQAFAVTGALLHNVTTVALALGNAGQQPEGVRQDGGPAASGHPGGGGGAAAGEQRQPWDPEPGNACTVS